MGHLQLIQPTRDDEKRCLTKEMKTPSSQQVYQVYTTSRNHINYYQQLACTYFLNQIVYSDVEKTLHLFCSVKKHQHFYKSLQHII